MLGPLFSEWTASVPGLGFRDRLMLDQTQFQQLIFNERLRASRRGIPFCVITLTLNGSHQRRRRSILLTRLLHRHLRLTDQKGKLGSGKFAALLVDTPEMGGRCAMDRLAGLIARRNLNVDVTLSVHDHEGFESDTPAKSVLGRRRDDALADSPDDASIASGNDGPVLSLSEPVLSLSEPKNHVRELATHRGTVAVMAPVATKTVAMSAQPHNSYDVYDVPAPPRPRVRMGVKRTIDILGASAGLVALSPFLAVAMVMIRREDGGPVLFKQTREGLDGKPFTIYKLRSMVINAERRQAELRAQSHRDGPAFKIDRDPRITKVGNFLRKSCMDELPQLWNVVKGDMSLVGPRPLPWHESRQCERWHRRRLDVRPGLTCYWQIDKAATETFDDWMRLDLRYVDRLTLWEDLKLIFLTIKVPVLGRGGE